MKEDTTSLLRSGVGRAIITPPVGFDISGPEFPDRRSVGVEDDLLVRCLVVESYGVCAALVSLDVWGIAPIFEHRIYETIARSTRIPYDNILLTCTGNGTSPPLWRGKEMPDQYRSYMSYLPEVIAGATLSAQESMQPCAAGAVSASLPNLNCYSDGRPSSNLDNELHHLSVLAATDAAGQVLSLVTGFACPANIRGETNRWTADYPGFACWAMEQSGVESALFIQGICSNVRPFDWHDSNSDPSHAGREASDAQALGVLLATQAAQALGKIQVRRNAVVSCAVDEASGVRVLRISDAIIIALQRAQPVEFATRIRRGLEEYSVFVNANRESASLPESESDRIDQCLLDTAIDLSHRVTCQDAIA